MEVVEIEEICHRFECVAGWLGKVGAGVWEKLRKGSPGKVRSLFRHALARAPRSGESAQRLPQGSPKKKCRHARVATREATLDHSFPRTAVRLRRNEEIVDGMIRAVDFSAFQNMPEGLFQTFFRIIGKYHAHLEIISVVLMSMR